MELATGVFPLLPEFEGTELPLSPKRVPGTEAPSSSHAKALAIIDVISSACDGKLPKLPSKAFSRPFEEFVYAWYEIYTSSFALFSLLSSAILCYPFILSSLSVSHWLVYSPTLLLACTINSLQRRADARPSLLELLGHEWVITFQAVKFDAGSWVRNTLPPEDLVDDEDEFEEEEEIATPCT
eukprot:m.45041 g.45041  ORF g.45041 m.45041 type:complete len:183 (+) comp10860_c0_seq2:1378-1926(+)